MGIGGSGKQDSAGGVEGAVRAEGLGKGGGLAEHVPRVLVRPFV